MELWTRAWPQLVRAGPPSQALQLSLQHGRGRCAGNGAAHAGRARRVGSACDTTRASAHASVAPPRCWRRLAQVGWRWWGAATGRCGWCTYQAARCATAWAPTSTPCGASRPARTASWPAGTTARCCCGTLLEGSPIKGPLPPFCKRCAPVEPSNPVSSNASPEQAREKAPKVQKCRLPRSSPRAIQSLPAAHVHRALMCRRSADHLQPRRRCH